MDNECNWCHHEVPPSEARSVATALSNAHPDQRREYEEVWGAMPSLIHAREFLDSLGLVNGRLFERSEHSPSAM